MRVAALILLLLAGCAGTGVEPSYYLLRSEQASQSAMLNPSRDFSLGKVEIAAYLDQPGLVMEMADGQMRPASQNLWAEPIHDGVRNFLATEISLARGEELLPSRLAPNTTVVDIRIDQLHGTLDGKARIVAYWTLLRDGEVVAMNRFAETLPLVSSGYAALLEAEKILLRELANRIARSLHTASA